MAKQDTEQARISLGAAGKTDVRTQFGALCYRVKNGELQFCLVSSRGTGRWLVPKGWPMDGETPGQAAATEAWEEAGIEGRVRHRPLGVYSYFKTHNTDAMPCVVVVFTLKVKKAHSRWPECKERQRRWVPRRKAARMIDEPELRQMILRFDPKLV